MTRLLRFLGVVNAAVWLGGSVFLTFVAGPAFFSADMRQLLGPTDFPRLSGSIAELVLKRYFLFHGICGSVALLTLFLQRLCLGRGSKWALRLVLLLVAINLAGGLWLAPKLGRLHEIRQAAGTLDAEREAATRSFRAWHGVSQAANLLVVCGLVVHLGQMSASRRDQKN